MLTIKRNANRANHGGTCFLLVKKRTQNIPYELCTGALQIQKINVFVANILGVSPIMLRHFRYDSDKRGSDNRGSTVA